MAKGVIEYDLPLEQCEFDMAQDGMNAITAISKIDSTLRDKIRYCELPEEVEEALEEIRDHIREVVEKYNIRHVGGINE